MGRNPKLVNISQTAIKEHHEVDEGTLNRKQVSPLCILEPLKQFLGIGFGTSELVV